MTSDQKTTSLGKRSSTGDSDNENERYPDDGREPDLGGQSMSAEALRRLRRCAPEYATVYASSDSLFAWERVFCRFREIGTQPAAAAQLCNKVHR